MWRISATALGVVAPIGPKGFLEGSGQLSSHRLGRIPLTGASGLGDLAIGGQRMAILHEHVAPVAGQRPMGLGFAAQQCVGITAGALGLVIELDAAEVSFRPLPAGPLSTKSLARPDGGGGGSPSPSMRSREAWDAQAWSNVPSTEKCSWLRSGLTSGESINLGTTLRIMSPLSSRSRFW